MTRRTISRLSGTGMTALALSACAVSRPPQSAFYCLDVPSGQIGEVRKLVDATAKRLEFGVSEGIFPFERDDVHHSFEVYGKGISLFVQTAMASGPRDQFGNAENKANPKRYSVQAVKTGWWQRTPFSEGLSALAVEARSARMGWSKAPDDNACSI